MKFPETKLEMLHEEARFPFQFQPMRKQEDAAILRREEIQGASFFEAAAGVALIFADASLAMGLSSVMPDLERYLKLRSM